MQNLGELGKWANVSAGANVLIPQTASTRASLRVNAARKTVLTYRHVDGDQIRTKGNPTFLALVEGMEEITFRFPGSIAIYGDNDFMIETAANAVVPQYTAGESFARIVERRTVSREVAEVVSRANANQRHMLGQMQFYADRAAASEQRLLAALKEPRYAAPVVDLTKSAGGDAQSPVEPKSNPDTGAPGAPGGA